MRATSESALNRLVSGPNMARLSELMPYFEKSVTFTPPNEVARLSNASTQYDASAFTNDGGPVQVGYTNFVSSWATWLEKGLQAVGMQRTTGFASGNLMGYHYSQSTIRASDQTRSSSSSYIYQAKAGSTGKKLKVYTQTMVKKIVFDGKKATGVKASLFRLTILKRARR
jgi:choline dehydrogenase